MAADIERHLLFGLIALQVGLIDQARLVAAFQAWARDKARPLPDHLAEQGSLDTDGRAAVEAMVALHIKKHDCDPKKSLASIPTVRSTREQLAALADTDLEATVTRLGSGPDEPEDDRTLTYAVVNTTSGGERYRVLRPHARGGLGAVFVALDGELHREVALKQILDEHADDPASRQRFVTEAEITGGLEHPGIVPVYGLGTYESGRPFYAMRFIRGDSLKQAIMAFHVDPNFKGHPGARSLALRKLLRRFTDVCNAIDYAHHRGVLHRDIKPGNVIVGKYGETLVVDWGLAKATGRSDPSAEERTLRPGSTSGPSQTLPGSALGTPAYMSPEQAVGDLDRLGPPSDVYSLGATLYCLLTGKPPFDGTLHDLLEAVRAGRYAPPREVDPSLDRALEAVCLKAMALRPEDRYPTAHALAEDVERWMADEPVTAWREPLTRRARRWTRMHRTLVVSAGAVLAATTVALAAGLWLLGLERQRTEQHFRVAHRLAAQLVETAELRLSERPGQESTRKALFEEAIAQYLILADQRPGDAELQAEMGLVHFYMANLLRFMNDSPGSDRHFDSALHRLDRARTLNPRDPRLLDRLAEAWRDRGLLSYRIGKNGEARRRLGRALEFARSLRGEDPESVEYRRTEASILLGAADVEASFGKDKEAVQFAREAVERYRDLMVQGGDAGKVAPAYATSTAARTVPLLYLMALNKYAAMLADLDRNDEALLRHEEAVNQARALVVGAKTPDNRFQHGKALALRGDTLSRMTGKREQAEASLIEAQGILASLLAANTKSSAYREAVATTHRSIAKLRTAQGNTDAAEKELAAALVELDWLVKAAPQVPRFSWERGLVLDDMALVARAGGQEEPARRRTGEAKEALRKAVALAPENVPYRRDLERLDSNTPVTPSGPTQAELPGGRPSP